MCDRCCHRSCREFGLEYDHCAHCSTSISLCSQELVCERDGRSVCDCYNPLGNLCESCFGDPDAEQSLRDVRANSEKDQAEERLKQAISTLAVESDVPQSAIEGFIEEFKGKKKSCDKTEY